MGQDYQRWLRLILNGKSTADLAVREAVTVLRDQGHRVEVRVTYEDGDALRFASEAVRDEVEIACAGGGDGTLNEVLNGFMQTNPNSRTALSALPLGTANDFATSVNLVYPSPLETLQQILQRDPIPIDVGRVNDRYFVNVASGGFSAEVSANTPPQLKRALGGAAYSLMGVVVAAKMNPYTCQVTVPGEPQRDVSLLLLAVGNGNQCGGGYDVTRHAKLNDGLLDLVMVYDAEIQNFGQVLSELNRLDDDALQYVSYDQVASFDLESSRPLQLTLDGEPYLSKSFHFEIVPDAVRFVLGEHAPLVG